MYKITVVGGGNGAFAVASDLALKGHQVTLCDLPAFEGSLLEIKERGGILLESLPSSGRGSGFAPLFQVTVDMQQALTKAEIVFVVVPAYAQKAMAQACAPFLKKQQTLCLMPGNLYGSIEFLQELRKNGNLDVEAVAEAECLIYTATRKEFSVAIRGFKRGLGLSVFPARMTSFVAPKLLEVYPEMTLRKNVLATGVSNPNVFLHVPLVLLNFTNIERGLDVLAYHAAFTQGVARVVEALDQERMQLKTTEVGDIDPIGVVMRKWYSAQGAAGEDLHTIMSTNPLYVASRLPKSKNHRYFTEDIPYGICPMSELLNLFELPNPCLKAIASLASAAWGKDFSVESRTLSSLGLRCTVPELLSYVHAG